MAEIEYEVLSPEGESATQQIAPVDGLADREVKRVAFVWDNLFRGDLMFEQIAVALRRQWPDVEFVGHEGFGNFHGPDEPTVMAELPGKLTDAAVDAAVIGVGACGSCTPAVVRACAAAERAGVRAVGLVAEGFLPQARAIAAALGLSDGRIATYPGVIMTDDLDTFREKVDGSIVPETMAGLLSSDPTGIEVLAGTTGVYDPTRTVFSGSLEEVQRHFESRLWSDGLPVMPPTPAAVDHMLSYTDRAPDEVIGKLLPANRIATVRVVAVNAVMAGCDPRHLPLLIAAAESISHPTFGIEHGGCTPGWEPFAIVSGPDTPGLGFNSSTTVLRAGVRANTTLGRFLRLYMRNVAGLVGPPGETDKATFGGPTHIALAESEEATRALGWPTLRAEMGFADTDTVVTVQSALGFSLPIYTSGDTPENHLKVLAENIAGFSGHWSNTGLRFKEWQPLLVMAPGIAAVFARNGWSKDDIRRDLGDRARVPWGMWRRYAPGQGNTRAEDFDDRLVDGTARAAYRESDDPERLVPVIPFPERLAIVVAGDHSRNQSRYYVNNHVHGPRIATRVAWGTEAGQ